MTALSTPNEELNMVLPEQAGDHGHDQEGRDQQGSGDAPAEELAIKQKRQGSPDQQRQQHRCGGHADGDRDRVEEERVRVALGEVLQPHEVRAARRDDLPVVQAEEDVEEEWDLRHHDGEQQRGRRAVADATRRDAGTP